METKKALELGCWKHCPETKSYGEVTTLGLEKECDVRVDLLKHKMPFPNNHFDFIWAHQVIEHFPDTLRILKECLRVLKPGGKMEIHVPHYLHSMAWGNATHYKGFSRKTFSIFTDENKGRDDYGTHVKCKEKLLWYNHRVQEDGSALGKLVDKFMTWFINRFPKLYDGHLVFILGAPEEIVYVVEKVKE